MDNEYPSDVEDDNITYSPMNSRKIGQFHTLCVDCNENMTGVTSVGELSKQVGDFVNIQNYLYERDLDFYNFYHKEIRAMNNGPYYNVATIDHPLSDFEAGDILPESVWCLNFHPKCKNWDGMVWCNASNICVDIYFNSGTGETTASVYGAIHACPQYLNMVKNEESVGKRLHNILEYFSFADGSNQKTVIQNGSDSLPVGGHVDTAGRRMISFIGCEDCNGFLAQIPQDISIISTNVWQIWDGRGEFGLSDDYASCFYIGASYNMNAQYAGTRAISEIDITAASTNRGERGVCDVSIV